MTINRHRNIKHAKPIAWVGCAFAILALVFVFKYDQVIDRGEIDAYPEFGIDPITTSSLRGASVIHTVSNGQLLRLANAQVPTNAAYTSDQLDAKINQLNELEALNSKCFRVTPYDVSPIRSQDWRNIDYELVGKYIDDGIPENTGVSREKLMADIWLVREAALQAEGTPQRFRTFGLYLLQVQNTLIDAHKHFGDDGYKWARKLVQTEYDFELAEHIQEIIPSKFYTRRLNQNMQLFAQDVTQFIPCSIRAKQVLTERSSGS